jgi:hypothetical protein
MMMLLPLASARAALRAQSIGQPGVWSDHKHGTAYRCMRVPETAIRVCRRPPVFRSGFTVFLPYETN